MMSLILITALVHQIREVRGLTPHLLKKSPGPCARAQGPCRHPCPPRPGHDQPLWMSLPPSSMKKTLQTCNLTMVCICKQAESARRGTNNNTRVQAAFNAEILHGQERVIHVHDENAPDVRQLALPPCGQRTPSSGAARLPT